MKTKKDQNVSEELNVDVTAAVATPAPSTQEVTIGEPESEESRASRERYEALVAKSRRILSSRLSGLSAAGLSFEKRTGNFFRSTLVNVEDKNGEVVLKADGSPEQRVARLVVSLYELDENYDVVVDANGEPVKTKEAAELWSEICIKRAAAKVVNAESEFAKLEKEREELVKAVEELNNRIEDTTAELSKAEADVDDYELPEATSNATASIKAKLTEVEEQAKRMRDMLIAMGIDPDTGNKIEG